MKKIALIITLVIVSHCIVLSQPPSPPADAGAANSGPVGNGAPIGSGLGIMLAMFAAWGGKKAWDAGRMSDPEDIEL
jgi:hypothetical protein